MFGTHKERRRRKGWRPGAAAMTLTVAAATAAFVSPISTGTAKASDGTWSIFGQQPDSNTLPSAPVPHFGRPDLPSWHYDTSGDPLTSAFTSSSSTYSGYTGGSFNLQDLYTSSFQSFASASPPPPPAIPGVKTWGPSGPAKTLVLYDTTGPYGFLGALYALGAGNLATHFGQVTAEPVVDYNAGQMSAYTATIYLGSTYNEPIPAALLADVTTTTHPVVWAGDNIWQVTGTEGSTPDTAFKNQYGWDPSNSFFTDSTAVQFNQVQYKGATLSRYDGSGAAPLLHVYVTNPAIVQSLATAVPDPAYGTSAQPVPWAVRSANLTYITEVPFSYVNETDRIMAFSDTLFDALAPNTAVQHRALVRLEDLTAVDDQNQIRQIGAYLRSVGVPFSFNVIPKYVDPLGYYNNGTPQTVNLYQSAAFVQTIRQLMADGGTAVDEGLTHQFSNIANPYDGVSGDDFEFYRAQCSSTNTAPYSFDAPCPSTDWVIEQGPVPGDSANYAQNRMAAAKAQFRDSGLPVPNIFLFPHYAGSAVDYQVEAQQYSLAYDRRLYFGNTLAGGTINYSSNQTIGQFFPFSVKDVYGATVIPENLGDYEPTPINNNVTRLPADIIHEAQLNSTVRDGVASFFYDPTNGLGPLQQTVQGVQGAGYTFVSPASYLANP